ncbi:MAG: cell surface protein [Aquaticitalea sp.]
MNSKHIVAICTLLILSSCNSDKKQVTNSKDYNNYLELAENKNLQNAESNREFWTKKLVNNPTQLPYLGNIASSYSHLFAATGDIAYLKEAEKNLIQAHEYYNYQNLGSLMGLASNYISQHKFKEALMLLTKAELLGDHLSDIQKMIFDVQMELGNYDMAKVYLEKLENMNDFDYLIRLSKWSDHYGNLDATIKYLEKAQTIAESSKKDDIMYWTYTNLADFYGHAGRVEESYKLYLKALNINPDDAYSKKGIAWIAYSYENNPDEALRILNTVTETYHSPDYFLLKAQIYEYKSDTAEKEAQLKLYKEAVKNPSYGDMYNMYNVILYNHENENLDEAIAIAKIEVENRPTPTSYDLLAWSYFNNGNLAEALKIVKTHIIDHTSHPLALLHCAVILKAGGETEKANEIKNKLEENNLYELGPVATKDVNRI